MGVGGRRGRGGIRGGRGRLLEWIENSDFDLFVNECLFVCFSVVDVFCEKTIHG